MQFKNNLAKNNLFFISLLLLIVILMATLYIHAEGKQETGMGFPLDDSWIHLRFAKNLARGYGFCFNRGEPVSGSTAPLWTLLIVPIHVIFRNPLVVVIMVKILGILLFCLAVLFFYLLSIKILKNRTAAFIAAALIATTIHLNWGAISGLEIPLYLFLTSFFLNLYYSPSPRYKKFFQPMILGLTVYARPECLLLFIFYIIDKVVVGSQRKNKLFLITDLIIYSMTIMPYIILNINLSGSIFPNTFRIKAMDQSIFTAIATFNLAHLKWLFGVMAPHYFSGFILHLHRANPLFPLGLFFGIVFWLYKMIKFHDPDSLFLPMVVIFYSTLIGLIAPFLGPDFQGGRYIANQTAIGVLMSFLGFFWLWQILKQRYKIVADLLIAVLSIIFVYNTVIAQRFMVNFYQSNVKSINTIQVGIGKWAKQNIPDDALIAVNDIGAIGYFSDQQHIIDLVGLITPEIKSYFKKYNDKKLGTYAYIFEKKPDYLIIFPKWYPRLLELTTFEKIYAVSLKNNTASEWVFTPQAETWLGLIYKRILAKPIESQKIVLKAHW